MIVRLRSRWVIIPLILFAILTGLWLLDGWLAERRWHAYAAAARARGVKLTMQELLPAQQVPDVENFGATPMWVAASAGSLLEDPRYPPNMQFAGRWKKKEKPDGKPRAEDLSALRALLISEKWLEKSDTAGSDAEAILRGMQRLEPSLQELHTAASRPKTQFVFDWSRGYRTVFPYLDVSRRMLTIVKLRCAVLIQVGGRESEALSTWKDGMRLAEAIRTIPSLPSGFIARRLESTLRDTLWNGMCDGVWSDAALMEMGALLAARNTLAAFQRSLECERVILSSSIDEAFQNEELMSNFRDMDARNQGGWYNRIRIPRRGWLRSNQLRLNEVLLDQLRLLDATREINLPNVKPEFDLRAIAANPDPHSEQLIRTYVSVAHYHDQALFEHALDRMAGVGCALERYKRAKGGYPEVLNELVPAYLARLPHDPCTGQPFIYRRDATEGFLLYSVGLDGNDDKGVMYKPDIPSGNPDWRWYAPVKP